MKYCSTSIIGLLAATVAASPAWAGERVFANPGETITLNGTVAKDVNANADPFTLQVYGGANECLRIAVLSQQADLEATLVGPSGRVWQDDDSGGSLRPLIKAITPSTTFADNTRIQGWHTLTVSQFDGHPGQANFTFQISRFATTDSRCNPPTGPRVFAPTTLKSGQAPAGNRSLPGSP